MEITKKNIGQIVLGVYIVGSLGYIGYSQWTNFKAQYADQAFQSGQADAVAQLINQAENPGCQPFTVYNQQKKVELVNVTCLQAATTDGADTTTETNPTN